MQTLETRVNIIAPPTEDADQVLNSAASQRPARLKGVYRQLFKENRDLDFFHNVQVDSAYLDGRLTTRELVRDLLKSEMYRDYILLVNSNYRFVALTFERVLGRPATDAEQRTWASLLATEGLDGFADRLTSTDEYVQAFGDDQVPTRRSQKLFSSQQGLPALPDAASSLRYDGPGRTSQMYGIGPDQSVWGWNGSEPPAQVRKLGAVFAVAGVIEVARILLAAIASALGLG